MILNCTCVNSAQDSLHGSGRRVHNVLEFGMKKGKYRCTVCKAEREKKGFVVPAEDKKK